MLDQHKKVADMGFVQAREIRLADVLLAIEAARPIHKSEFWVNNKGWIVEYGNFGKQGHPAWNLKDDNLDHQSDPTKQLLIDLLVK